MENKKNDNTNFSSAMLKRMIYWVRAGLVSEPEGVFFVANQVLLSLVREQDTVESLGASFQELTDLWSIANRSADEAECRRRLTNYYKLTTLKSGGAVA
jgi:hypothetical protein